MGLLDYFRNRSGTLQGIVTVNKTDMGYELDGESKHCVIPEKFFSFRGTEMIAHCPSPNDFHEIDVHTLRPVGNGNYEWRYRCEHS